MQTKLAEQILATHEGKRADAILRSCVHCGFCTATCPTYQLLGDELDSPRGRIYLIKQVLEGQQITRKTMTHLDRCLTCRSCETTCPSGVKYAQLVDIGRNIVEKAISRSLFDKLRRESVHWLLSRPKTFARLFNFALKFNPLLPRSLQQNVPSQNFALAKVKKHSRKVLLLQGCVQPTLAPDINQATRMVLDRMGIQVSSLKQVECCGALSHHANKHEQALSIVKNNIDAWWPCLNKGYEAIISNASGCGIMLKDYAQLLEHDSVYAEKARLISDSVKDISEMFQDHDIEALRMSQPLKAVFHPPCTLQHGLRLLASTEKLLADLNFDLQPIADKHLCCGSAGTYSIFQAKLAMQLKQNKLRTLQEHHPDYIITANIGCQQHLQSATTTPVKHWIELLALHLPE